MKKHDNFTRIAVKRVNNIASGLSSLEKISTSSYYEYSMQEVQKIFNFLEQRLAECKRSFSKKTPKKFTLAGTSARLENVSIGSITVDVELQPNDLYDVYIAHDGGSGLHYKDVSADDIGRLVSDEIQCWAEAYSQDLEKGEEASSPSIKKLKDERN